MVVLHRNMFFLLFAVGAQYLLTQYRLEHFSRLPARLRALLWGDAHRARLVEGALGARAPEPAQPDAVRGAPHAAQPLGVNGESGQGQCSSRIRSSSSRTTLGVRVGVRTTYRGGGGGGQPYAWSYRVLFENIGEHAASTTIMPTPRTVQMLTRHWVFTDANGKVDEVKGPGARGSTPILAPGESWSYESGTQLATAAGSMVGSFQFEVLEGAAAFTPSAEDAGTAAGKAARMMFSVPIARTALLASDGGGGDRGEGREMSVQVPCGAEAPPSTTHATTSVTATRRVIVGVTTELFAEEEEEGRQRKQPETTPEALALAKAGLPHEAAGAAGALYKYDVQVNNARAQPVRCAAT